MSAAYTVLQVPAHLVPRTCSGPRGKMALGAIHTDHITVLRPLLPPPRVGHEGRTFKPLRSRSRAKPSSQDSQQSTTPAALGPPLHPHSRVGGSWAGGGHPPCGPVKSAAVVCSAHTSGGESLSSAQGEWRSRLSVSWGLCGKLLQTEWLKTTQMFWRSEVKHGSYRTEIKVPKAASWKGHMYLPLMICWPMQFTPDSVGEGKYPESQYPK
ncbi:uncharacterized protein LOC132021345 isoform X1 [Mustela nigripes]|uniref:uncharacterized protein LOC132021345 isoform X1 n=1 Tax=Mustela nigripes TaxID=77151 RepID=UPI0028155C09|nr:uncharacterized protein LOC132021345 isoform X1 [Mustela nigripes]